MGDLILTKVMDLAADLPQLTPELTLVDQIGTDRQTPESRRWEYAMALRATNRWSQLPTPLVQHPQSFYDVGGSGSLFYRMMLSLPSPGLRRVRVVDPHEDGETLQQVVLSGDAHLADCVYCLSVLEHLEPDEVPWFLYHLSCLVRPGGLLFLTCDYWDGRGTDTAHFHWMRQQIFNLRTITTVLEPLQQRDLDLFGRSDFSYHGHQLYGSYSVASVAMVKRL